MSNSQEDSQNKAAPIVFRRNVAAILKRDDGRVFVGERSDYDDAWQFPQGGVDEGETLVAALQREIEEETGLRPSHYEIIDQRDGYRYIFPDGHRKWKEFRGQEQTYFLCRFTAGDDDIFLDSDHQEFTSFRWVLPAEFDLGWLPEFKRDVYRKVLADFFGV